MFTFLELPHIPPKDVAIWCGNAKPNDLNEYLKRFVEEMNHLLENGISINNHQIKVRIRCFICDTRARAFSKGNFFRYKQIKVKQREHNCPAKREIWLSSIHFDSEHYQ